MKLLISPAKKMRDGGDSLPPETVPSLLEKSAQLLDYLRGLSLPELKRLLAVSYTHLDVYKRQGVPCGQSRHPDLKKY